MDANDTVSLRLALLVLNKPYRPACCCEREFADVGENAKMALGL